jgi:hypothetical protein
MIWGRTDSEWSELVDTTAKFLAERAKLQRTTSYTELNTVLVNRTGARPFDFDIDQGRAAMGALLGEVATDRFAEAGALISAIVVYLNENDAGAGFYRLAASLDLLPARATAAQKFDFWATQVKTIHEHYREPGR